MTRPYMGSSISDLKLLFETNSADLEVLENLLHELGFRKTKSARQLLAQIAARVADLSDEDDAFAGDVDDDDLESRLIEESEAPKGNRDSRLVGSESLFGLASQDYELPPDDAKRPKHLVRIRPPGTPRLPSSYHKTLDQSFSLDLPQDADLLDQYISALGALIAEIKKSGSGQKRYEIENGVQIESRGTEAIYSFPFTDEADIFEDAQVEVELSGQRVLGSIVSISAGRLVLALKDDVGLEIKRAILLIDATALLEALKEKIEQIKKGDLAINRAIADAVIGQADAPPDPKPIPGVAAEELNTAQQKAFQRVLTTAITYIWGPPGCGKTKTLGEIVRAAFEADKRILVCSNTNKAVDQVLFRICEALGKNHPALDEGRVVRLGRIADDKLKNEYEDYVTVDGIVARRSAHLEARKIEIEQGIARIDAHTVDAQQTLELFRLLEVSSAEVERLKKAVNDTAAEGRRQQEVRGKLNGRIVQLEAELQKRTASFFGFMKRSEAAIQKDMETTRHGIAACVEKIGELHLHYQQIREDFENAQGECKHRQKAVEQKDREAASRAVRDAEAKRNLLVQELREIENQIGALRDALMRDARTLGATCTKSYLSAKEIGQVDLVIIDEASMVMLPMVWFAAGLSRERVVVCGDFRQIAPIVQTEKQAIFDVLGNDVFTEIGMAEDPSADGRLVMLDTQYRMRLPICNLISGPMYDNQLTTWAGMDNRRVTPLPPSFDQVLTIIDTSDLWPFETQNAFYSRFNLMHALLVRNLAWHFHDEGYIESYESLGICTPYAAQAKLIQKLLEGEGLDHHVQVGTVHRFQGDERHTVVLEIPESHGGAQYLGQFIQGIPPSHTGARLLNVAVSRAQDHLIVMANLTYLDKKLPSTSLLRAMLYEMQEQGRIIMGRELLKMRPIESDLKGLLGRVDLKIDATTFGLFDEKSFDPAFREDILVSKESVVIFSGFITPRRVGEIGDLLRAKVNDGVKVRCVTRPSKHNGSMDPALGKEALDILEGIGCVVDCRRDIHQKIVLIDNKVVWHGSLNALSHAHRTEESMTRVVNEGLAQTVAANMSKLRVSAERAASIVADAENPRCPECGSRTVYAVARRGRGREFFYCEADCGWRESLWKTQRHGNTRTRQSEQSDLPKDGPPCPECGAASKLRSGRYGPFYGCARFPDCKGVVNLN